MKKDILTSIFVGALTFGALHVIKRLWRRYLRPIRKYTTIDLIGNTPLLYLKELSKLTKCEIYAKLEYLNPGGSLKDRLAKQIVLDGEAYIDILWRKSKGVLNRAGQLKNPGDRIYEGTSGSTGISLALLAAFRGYECILYLPDDLSEEKYNSLELVGAKLNKVRPVSIIDSEHFCKLAEKAAKETSGFYANQFENLSNFKTHYNNTGPEIYKQTNGKVTTFVASAGTGGTIAGVSTYLKHKNSKVKVILADPPGSSLMNKINFGVLYTHEEAEGHRVKHPFDTITEGIGLNRLTKNFEIAKIDQAFRVTDEESLAMGKFLIEKEGIFVGSSSALNAVACVKAARTFGKGQVIVTIFSDSGTRYMSKFYSRQWLTKYNEKLLESLKHNSSDLSFVL